MGLEPQSEIPNPSILTPKAIPFKLEWIKGKKHVSFTQADTWWTLGKRFVGKSSWNEVITTHYLKAGASALDLFCSRDNESLAWCRSPFKDDVVLLVGNTISLEFEDKPYQWMRVNEFSIKEAERHRLMVTAPKLYSTENEQYCALSAIVDDLKWRDEFTKTIVLVVREAGRLLRARVVAGAIKSQMDAEWDMIDLIQEAYHSGIAVTIDSLRPLSIEKSIRQIANYTIIKRIGRQELPDEFKYLMSIINPSDLRIMPINKFVMWTDEDMIAIGRSEMPPWHIERGESLIKKLGIKVKYADASTEITVQDSRRKVTAELHKRIIDLRNQGLSYEKIARHEEINLNVNTVRTQIANHQKGRCLCCA